MLGALVYEAQGKIAGYRILDVEGPKIEVTIIQNGTLRGGIEATDTVTYWSIPRSGGAYYAEGKGVFMAKDNLSEMATWTGQGIAYYSGQKRRDVGSVFCRTPSTSGKLAFLNNMVGVFEYETDEMGNSSGVEISKSHHVFTLFYSIINNL
jgi:hypothetical protein